MYARNPWPLRVVFLVGWLLWLLLVGTALLSLSRPNGSMFFSFLVQG